MKTSMTLVLFLFLSASLGACAGVEPIDLHDPLVPIEARKFVADAEDSVAVARVRHDEAAMLLAERKAWRSDVLDRKRWKGSPSEVRDQLRDMADAHVDLAQFELEGTEARIRLAEAKRDLLTARTAVRHDLATYDLERLEQRVEERRAEVREVEAELADQRVKVERATRDFWKRYATLDFSDGSPLFVTLEE